MPLSFYKFALSFDPMHSSSNPEIVSNFGKWKPLFSGMSGYLGGARTGFFKTAHPAEKRGPSPTRRAVDVFAGLSGVRGATS